MRVIICVRSVIGRTVSTTGSKPVFNTKTYLSAMVSRTFDEGLEFLNLDFAPLYVNLERQ